MPHTITTQQSSRMDQLTTNKTKNPPGTPRSGLDLYLRYALAGGQCCAITHTVLVPVDVVKTRLQAQSGRYNGMMDAFVTISKTEGAGALFLGLAPTAVGYMIQGACKFGFYEVFKSSIASATGKDKSQLGIPAHMLSAGMAETIASVALCPWEALRIKMVGQPSFATGVVDGFKKITKAEGVLGLYKGLGPILMKQVPYTVTQLVVFTKAVDFIYNSVLPRVPGGVKKEQLSLSSQLSISLLGGVIAGVAGALVSHPADTILTRINMPANGAAKNSLSTVVRELGWKGLWLGVGPRCLMVSTLSAGMFLIYDSVKVLCGLPPSGGGH